MIKARGLKYLNKFLLLSIMGIRKEGMVQWHLPKEGNQQMILELPFSVNVERSHNHNETKTRQRYPYGVHVSKPAHL